MSKNGKSKYHKNLFQQGQQKLCSMRAIGESKSQAKKDGTIAFKIFSENTYDTYLEALKLFTKWLTEYHPEIELLKHARLLVGDWLLSLEASGKSACTVHTYAKALGKFYGIAPEDLDYFDPKKRRREDYTRSRQEAKRDRFFSEEKNSELVSFSRATGMRRSEYDTLHGADCTTREELLSALAAVENIIPNITRPTVSDAAVQYPDIKLFKVIGRLKNGIELYNVRIIIEDALLIPEYDRYLIIKGKGGKVRCAPIINNVDAVWGRVMGTDAGKQVWLHIPFCADIHSYRADYATAIYKHFARPIDEIPYDISVPWKDGKMRRYKSEVFCCRRDQVGKKLDKRAMLYSSKSLGHNRLDVVSIHYLRNI